MNKKLIWVVISLLVVASMLSIFVVSCGEEEETTPPPTTPPPTTPAEEPEYGGTLTIRNFFIFPGSFDPTAGMGVGAGGNGYNAYV